MGTPKRKPKLLIVHIAVMLLQASPRQDGCGGDFRAFGLVIRRLLVSLATITTHFNNVHRQKIVLLIREVADKQIHQGLHLARDCSRTTESRFHGCSGFILRLEPIKSQDATSAIGSANTYSVVNDGLKHRARWSCQHLLPELCHVSVSKAIQALDRSLFVSTFFSPMGKTLA